MTVTCSCLIVDDDPFQCKLLAYQIRSLGATLVTACNSATEALNRIDTGEIPDILILDLNLPEMDGIEVLRHLATRNYSGSLILVSGEEEALLLATERLARLHHLQVLGHVRKPVTPEALAAVLVCHQFPAMLPHSPSRAYGPEAVAQAIENGELCGFYQPKVRVSDRKVVGAEYLLRWQHPKDGLVFPDRFIPTAEAHGLIGRLTMAVLNDALNQLKSWQTQGLDFKVAINVSMDDLSHPTFADQLLERCQESGVAADQLVLEVTESRLDHNLTSALEVLSRLRLHRLRLSIDDFGTGHSSLARLRDLPFDELKIDRSFTHRAWEDPRRQAIFETSLEISRRLGLDVVAEGVEDSEDWYFLKASGYPLLAQGYHIARPMPAEAFPAWMETWQA